MRAALRANAAAILGAARPGDVRRSRADLTRLQGWLGHPPRMALDESRRELLGAAPRPAPRRGRRPGDGVQRLV